MDTNSPQKASSSEEYVVLFVTIACLAISWWQTGNGYSKAFGHWIVSFILASALVATMFVQNRKIREGIQNNLGSRHLSRAWLLYVFVTLVSFAGNFNSFYSNFIGADLLKQELNVKRDSLQSISARANSALVSVEGKDLENYVNSKIEELKMQILNEGNLGCGPRAKLIIKDVEKKLDASFTPLVAKSSNKSDLEDITDQYAKMIRNALDVKLDRSNTLPKKELSAEITKKSNLGISNIDKMVGDYTTSKAAIAVINESVNLYKSIGTDVKREVSGFVFDEKFKVENNRLGEIDHSFNSALERVTHWATIWAFLLSIVIDLLPPLLIVLTAGFNKDKDIMSTYNASQQQANNSNSNQFLK